MSLKNWLLGTLYTLLRFTGIFYGLLNSPARYTEGVMANFALTQGVSEEDVADWKLQLDKAEALGRFGFTSFPVMTSAYLG